MIIIPFYVNHNNIEQSKYENNCKLLLTCLNSYYYNGNIYNVEVVTNDNKIIPLLKKMNKPFSINKVDDEFFQTVKVGNVETDLPQLQTMVKLSTIYNYSSEQNHMLLDFDTMFMDKIRIEKYLVSNKHFTLFMNSNFNEIAKTVREFLWYDYDDMKPMRNVNDKWLNSGVVIFRDCKKIIDNSMWIYNENTIKHSDEYFFNHIGCDIIRDDMFINNPPVSEYNNTSYGLVHFFNPWFKPYIVNINDKKELQIGITTDHKIDYIPDYYFSELLSYRKYHNEYFLYSCFNWWFYYGDVVGNIGDIYHDFRYYDSEYFKHLIEKLF